LGGIGVTHRRLGDGEFIAMTEQQIALCAHGLECRGAGNLGITELADGGTVGLQRDAGLLQVGLVLGGQLAFQFGDFLQGVVDGIEGRLLGSALPL
jgi:hypothetical protein